jgi:Tfp pilus assembly protein FimV
MRMAGQRPNKLRQALSLALLAAIGTLSMGPMTHAADIGKTEVQSAQNQPLSATIAVSGIDINDFSASLVGQDIYRQMGLQPNDSMAVRFEATSQTSGRILITTSRPVTAPFADVVIAIRTQDRQQIIPKTLLMPLQNSATATRVATNPPAMTAARPNLPVTTPALGTPLRVKRTAPPPLLSNTNADALSAVNLPRQATAPVTAQPSYQPSFQNSLQNTYPANTGAGITTNSANSTSTARNNPVNDRQLDILNVEVTRKIIASVPTAVAANATVPPANDLANNTQLAATPTQPVPQPKPQNNAFSNTVVPPTPAPAVGRYTVQRNDSLWLIANELARQNNLEVGAVMQQIKALNPNAFINNDINQLKAQAQLSLPNYEVIPSQQGLKAAIEARNTRANSNNRTVAIAPVQPKPTAAPVVTRTTTAVTKSNLSKKLPQATMTVLAPGKDGRADGTQTQASAATGSGINNDTLNTLKTTRQQTAQQAQRVREVTQQLAGDNKKLQLQSQKLAELEERLKELRNR